VYFRRQIDPLMLVMAVYGVLGFGRLNETSIAKTQSSAA
jgi:hypothetical protein